MTSKLERMGWEYIYLPLRLSVLTEIHPFFLNKYSMKSCRHLVNSQSCEKVDLDNFSHQYSHWFYGRVVDCWRILLCYSCTPIYLYRVNSPLLNQLMFFTDPKIMNMWGCCPMLSKTDDTWTTSWTIAIF